MTKESTKLWHIDAIDLLEGFPYEMKVAFEELVTTRTHKKNEYVYKSGEIASELFFVISGRVKIAKHASNGKECIKRIVNEGEFFGEIGVLTNNNQKLRNNFAQVMEHDTVVCSIDYEHFREVLKKYPKLQDRLTVKIIANFQRIDARLESIMFKDARTRLIEFIKELAEDIGKPVGHEMLIKHRFTHQEIANITAISRQKVTTLLNELKNDGLIHLERKSMLVHDMKLLKS
ncbi:MAG: Crp/Fnr family transcriptional regulator [Bacteroidota bacterium]